MRSIHRDTRRDSRAYPVSHLEVDDLQPVFPRGREHAANLGDNGPNDRGIDSLKREQPAFGAKVILHVDDRHGSSAQIDLNGFGLCAELHQTFSARYVLSLNCLDRSGARFDTSHSASSDAVGKEAPSVHMASRKMPD
jgi:hypothetical protein